MSLFNRMNVSFKFFSVLILGGVISACSVTSNRITSSSITPKSDSIDSKRTYPNLELEEQVPNTLKAEFKQALKSLAEDDKSKAKREFLAIHKAYPKYSGAAVNLARIEMDNDQAFAKKYLLAAIERNPSNYFAYNQLGIVERKLFNFKSAEDYYLQCLRLKEDYPFAWYNLASLYEVYLRDLPKSINAYNRYLGLVKNENKKVLKRVKRLERMIDE